MEGIIDYKLYEQREHALSHQPLENEDGFMKLIINGDTRAITENKRKYGSRPNEGKGRLSEDPLKNQIYHMVVNTTLITRAVSAAGLPHELAFTLSDHYISQTDTCRTVEDVMELNDRMVLDFAENMRRLRISAGIHPLIIKAVNSIYDNLHKDINVAQLAGEAGLDRSYFSALFKKEMGIPAGEFIKRARIKTAANILIHTDYRIIDISNTLCFSSQSYFCSVFRKEMGMTPMQYRRYKGIDKTGVLG